jgi:hypothetical protein
VQGAIAGKWSWRCHCDEGWRVTLTHNPVFNRVSRSCNRKDMKGTKGMKGWPGETPIHHQASTSRSAGLRSRCPRNPA